MHAIEVGIASYCLSKIKQSWKNLLSNAKRP